MYDYLKVKNKTDKIPTINDCCNSYIALFEYIYIQEGFYENEYCLFQPKFFAKFIELLNKYNILKDFENYYQNNLIYINQKGDYQNYSLHFREFIKCFEKESLGYKDDEIYNNNSTKINNSGSNNTPETSNTEIQNGKTEENENKKDSKKAIEIQELKAENKNQQDEISFLKNKSLEEKVESLTKELFKVKSKLEFNDIERCLSEIEIFQQLILNSEFNSAIINIESKRSEYLENIIN